MYSISKINSPSPKGGCQVKQTGEWNIYRTRFLVRAKPLTQHLVFTDALGREHRGEPGDYFVESSDGTTRITPKAIFEDIYVVMPTTTHNRKSAADPITSTVRKKFYEYRATHSA
jgi:hypothetical protein